MDLPKALRQCRIAKKLTQQEVAEKLGITRQAYNAYELGNRKLNIETAYEIVKILEITLDDLLQLAESY